MGNSSTPLCFVWKNRAIQQGFRFLSTLSFIGEEEDKGIATCDECGHIFTISVTEENESYILGNPECQQCGCEEFTEVEAEDLGL